MFVSISSIPQSTADPPLIFQLHIRIYIKERSPPSQGLCFFVLSEFMDKSVLPDKKLGSNKNVRDFVERIFAKVLLKMRIRTKKYLRNLARSNKRSDTPPQEAKAQDCPGS